MVPWSPGRKSVNGVEEAPDIPKSITFENTPVQGRRSYVFFWVWTHPLFLEAGSG